MTLTPAADSEGTSILNFFASEGTDTARLIPPFAPITNQPPPPNTPPTLDPIGNLALSEDAAQQSVALSGITWGSDAEEQGLVVTARSSDTSLVPNPIVNYLSPSTTGGLLFTPVPNANGTAVITVMVNDGQSQNSFITRSFEVNVTSVNDAPTLAPIANVNINKNDGLQTISLSGIGSGAANENQNLSVTAASSNPGLIPNPVVNYASPGATGTLSFAPATDATGNATITVTIDDGGVQNSRVSRTFTVTVNKVNSAPTLDPISNVTIAEDASQQTVPLTGIGPGGGDDPQPLNLAATSSNPSLIPNPTVLYVSPGSTGSLRFAPVLNAAGTATITVTANDGQPLNNTITRSFTVTVTGVNDAPTISDISDQTINENTATANLAFTIGDTETSAGSLTLAGASSNPTLVPTSAIVFGGSGANRTVRVTPALNQNGTALITVTVSDPDGGSVSDTFLLTVIAINRSPTLDPLNNLTLAEDAGPQTVQLSGITSGETNAVQPLTVTVSSSNPALVPAPTVDYISPNATGSLHLTPTANASGSAAITVTVNDGQAQNNVVTRSFTVTIGAANDPPTLNPIADVVLSEDAATQTVSLSGISSGASNELQVLTVTAVSSNPGLIPNPTVSFTSPNSSGSLAFTPIPNASGSALVTVTVNDGQALNNRTSRSFTVTVNAINDPPTLNAIAGISINRNDGPQIVPLAGISPGAANENQTLTVTAVSSNPGLIPNPSIAYASPSATGSLTFTPEPDMAGSATITVIVDDGDSQNNTVSRSFTVTVNKVNAPPTIDPIAGVTIVEDSPAQTVPLTGIGPGSGDDPQTLTVTATSSNPSLIANPTVTYVSPNQTGSLSLTPLPNATGSATITVTVSDGQSLNSTTTRGFTVTLTGVNDLPTISSIPDRTTGQNASTGPIPFTVNDVETPANSLVLSVVSSNPTLLPASGMVFGGSGSSRTLTITPADFQNGSSTVTISVQDSDGGVALESFLLTVTEANIPPTLNLLNNLTLNEDAGAQSVALSGISPGAAGENQTVSITAISSNPGLIPTPTVSYSNPDTTGQLSFQPVANGSGTAVITVRVDDGQSLNNAITRSFTVTVNAVNDPPTISAIPNQRVEPDLSSPPIPFTVNDVETAQSNLRLSVASSNPTLVPAANIVLSGTTSNRTVTVKPASGLTGTSTITISVNDGALTAATSFQFKVQPGNSSPKMSRLSNKTILSYYTPDPIEFTVEDAESDPDALIVTATSFSQTLMPDTNIVVGGTGSLRTISLHPIPDTEGFVTIAVTVSDGNLSTRSSFMVTVERGSPPTDRLVLEKDGNGGLSPDLSGQDLTVGRVYSMTAQPAAGQVFAGWSGTISSSAASLSFTMRSNMVLRARFMTNPFVPMKGSYNGLFFEPDEVRPYSSGFFNLVATDRGTFTGKLQSGSKSYPFKGNLDFDCKARVSVSRAGTNALTLEFQLGGNGLPDHITGSVSDGTWIADLAGDRGVFNSSTNPAPFAGTYTMAIPGRLGEASRPEGDGVATVKVDGGGVASFAGTLADGTKVTQRVQLSRRGEWPLYLSLYTGKGSLLSWLSVTNRAADDFRDDISGLMSWIKTSQPTSKIYPAGFTNDTVALGSHYVPPARGQRVLDLAEGNLLFSKGDLESDFVNRVLLSQDNRFANLSSNKLTVTLNPTSGLLTGTVTDPNSRKALKFNAVVLKKQNAALGSLFGTNRSSQVVLFK